MRSFSPITSKHVFVQMKVGDGFGEHIGEETRFWCVSLRRRIVLIKPCKLVCISGLNERRYVRECFPLVFAWPAGKEFV